MKTSRKDASHAPPVEQYRKQIGKQDWKRSKKDVKTLKNQSDMKKSSSIKDILLITGSVLAIVLGLYGWLFWYLSKS